jgi:hypothetical protein
MDYVIIVIRDLIFKPFFIYLITSGIRLSVGFLVKDLNIRVACNMHGSGHQ